MKMVVDTVRAASGKRDGDGSGSEEDEDGNGSGEEGRLKVPERAIREGVRVIRNEVERVVEIEFEEDGEEEEGG